MISSPKELLAFLEEIGASPKKSLSQNFLIDRNILDKMVADVRPGEKILEIGAGPGALTEALLAKGAHVIAIEKDDKFAVALKRFPSLEIFHGDVFDFPFDTLSPAMRVLGNLPYQLTSPILGLLLANYARFSSLRIMVQEEVARRMVAKPGTSDYSALSVFIHFYTQPRYAFGVKRRSFYPAPKVDSAVVDLEIRKKLPVEDVEGFFGVVRKAFQQRRKMLRSSLKGSSVEKALQAMGKRGDERPEALSLEEWVEFYSQLAR